MPDTVIASKLPWLIACVFAVRDTPQQKILITTK